MSNPARTIRNGLVGGLVLWLGIAAFFVWVMPV